MGKKYEDIIGRILVELDRQHATYQELHKGFHGKEDEEAKHIYGLLISLCERIRKETAS